MRHSVIGLGIVVSFVKNDINKRRKTYPSRNEFTSFLDVPYINDQNKYHTYDVYLADKSNRKNCCFIDVHGGSYVFGEHIDNYPYAYYLLKAGYDVVLVDYKPNNGKMDISDIVSDCVKCLSHLTANLGKYGLLNDKFILNGDSAGGHLAFLLSVMTQDQSVAKSLELEMPSLPLIGTAISCPVFNYTLIGNDYLSNVALKRMKGPKYKDFDHLNKYSPHSYVSNNKLPLFLSTCKYDFIRSESMALKEAMKGQNNFVFFDMDSDNKKVDHVHNITKPHLKESKIVNDEIIKFAEKLLKE